jgi:excisionase family DNA binding protein
MQSEPAAFAQKFELIDDPLDIIATLTVESMRAEALRHDLCALVVEAFPTDALVRLYPPQKEPTPEPLPTRAPEPKPAGSYNLASAAQFLGMSQRKLRKMVKDRRIACTRIDYRNFLFTEADLNEFLAAYRTKPRRI